MTDYTPLASYPVPSSGDPVQPTDSQLLDLATAIEVDVRAQAAQAVETAVETAVDDPRVVNPDDPGMWQVSPVPGVAAGFIDPETRTLSEVVIGPDGRVPSWVLARWAQRMATPRRTGVPLTCAQGDIRDTATDVCVRWPVRIAAPVSRWRLHVTNMNDRNGVQRGPISLTGCWVGAAARAADGTLNGAFQSAPVQAFGAATITSGEWISPWVDISLDAGAETIISMGYTCAAQDNHLGQGGGWRGTSAQASQTDAAGFTQARETPLDVWIEIEVPARTPIIGYLGDSLTVGTGATLPVHDGWPAVHAMTHGVVHHVRAMHGSTLDEWANNSGRVWSKWAGLDAPDLVIAALGSNDLFNGQNLANMQSRLLNFVRQIRSQICDHVVVTTVLPRDAADRDAVRLPYNDWLRTLPAGILQWVDLAGSVADPSRAGKLQPAYVHTDGVHLNSLGYAANARAVSAVVGAPRPRKEAR